MKWLKKMFGGASNDAKALALMDFADAFVAKAKEQDSELKATIERDGDTAKVLFAFANGMERTSFLANAYSAYLSDPASLPQVLETYTQSLFDRFDEPLQRAWILPVLKSLSWQSAVFEQLKTMNAKDAGLGQEAPVIALPLVGDLVLTYVEDKPESMAFLLPKRFAEMKMSEQELYELSLKNLERLFAQIDIQSGNGMHMVVAGGNYEASMVLFIDRFAAALKFQGDPIFAVPARDLLLIVDSLDAEAVEHLRLQAEGLFGQVNYALSPNLFRWSEEKGFEVFER